MLTHFKVPQYLLLLMFSLSVMSESFVTLWSVVHQVPLSVGYPREEYWSGLPFPSPGDLPDPGIEPTSPALAGRFYTTYAMLSHFSCFWLCATPQTAAHQAPPSLGYSREEYWSGLPFPSPMHESEKWKWSRSIVSDSSRPHGLQATRLLCPWDFPGKSTGVGCHCLLRKSLYPTVIIINFWIYFQS